MTAPAPLSGGDARTQLAEVLDEVIETVGLRELVQYATEQGSYCCTVGCGSGACESCPCCGAGWCVSGLDGLPDGDDDRARWLDIASEHNPVAASLRAASRGETGR